jgi:predicted nucleic acid-binding protein
MGQLFVDTWAWYALADRYDRDHVAAQQAIDSLLSDGESLVTTNFVVAESITLIRYHLHHTAAIQY